MITIPYHGHIEISIEKLIAHCDSTKLHELILLAGKKLDILEQDAEIVDNEEDNSQLRIINSKS